MTDAGGPQLLSHDKEMLDRVASPLREGRRGFSVLVCPPELWAAATGYLRERSGKEIPEPHLIQSGEEMVGFLARIQAKPPSEVASFAVEESNVAVLTALNWNREKVRRGGHVLAWLASAGGLQAFIRYAPDAYSFRDYTLALHGEAEPDQGWAGEEPPDVKTARLLFELPRPPEERAEAALELARALRRRGRIDEVARVAAEGLALIPDGQSEQTRQRDTRIGLLEAAAAAAVTASRTLDAFRLCREGMELCAARPEDAARLLWFELNAVHSGPVACRCAVVDQAASSIDRVADAMTRSLLLRHAAHDAAARGRFPAAAQYLGSALSTPSMDLYQKAGFLHQRARAHRWAGRFELARTDIEEANDAYLRAGYSVLPTIAEQAALLVDRAEIAAAAKLSASLSDRAGLHPGLQEVLVWYRTGGDVRAVVAACADQIRAAMRVFADKPAERGCLFLGAFLGGPRVVRSSESDIACALDVVDATGNALIARAAEDPPWYRVIFPAHRARILSLPGSRHDEAIAAASEAVALSRSLWKDALCFSTRVLVQCLARAGRFAAMGPPVQEALEAAREADHLRELSTIQAHDLVRLLRIGAPRASVDSALSALRHTFAEMQAPRVEAETWLEIEPFLPRTATFPDAVEIADRAHDLFLEMPMPEMAARCMEWLGDIYAARGERGQAERCYRMCLGTLNRYELFPRKPLVQEKLAAVLPAP